MADLPESLMATCPPQLTAAECATLQARRDHAPEIDPAAGMWLMIALALAPLALWLWPIKEDD